MAALQTKHWLFHCLKKEVLVSEPSSLIEKEACYLKLADISLQVMKFGL